MVDTILLIMCVDSSESDVRVTRVSIYMEVRPEFVRGT
jgi:hypothetical protein